MAIAMVSQSFRYKSVNVIFALPLRYYLDKVPRELCHFGIMMQGRVVGAVHRIYKSAYVDLTYTKFLGTIFLQLPSKQLKYVYERMRKDHQDALYETLRKQQAVLEVRKNVKCKKD